MILSCLVVLTLALVVSVIFISLYGRLIRKVQPLLIKSITDLINTVVDSKLKNYSTTFNLATLYATMYMYVHQLSKITNSYITGR